MPRGVAVDGAGDVFIADTYHSRVVELPAGGGAQTTVGSGLIGPAGAAVDAAGDVFIADFYNSRVVEVTPSGIQSTVGSGLRNPRFEAPLRAGPMVLRRTVRAISSSPTTATTVS